MHSAPKWQGVVSRIVRGLALSVLTWNLSCSKISDPEKPQGPKTEYPLALYDDSTTLSMHEGSRLSWVMKSLRLVKHSHSDRIEAKPVHLTVYDSLGAEMVRVTSDSGTVDEAVTFLAAIGHVHGHSHKGVDIRADSLRWNKNENRISTESRVRVISEEGDTLRGIGFISDANLDNWQILSNVQGVFQKIEERVEKADQDSAVSETEGQVTDPAVPDSGSLSTSGDTAHPPVPDSAAQP
jgi:LPS export ABC transporter protein LptC